MPVGIASICNAAARPYRVDSGGAISVVQWTRTTRIIPVTARDVPPANIALLLSTVDSDLELQARHARGKAA